MAEFVVSARKYRPPTFGQVVGQQHITTTLKNAIKTGHIAQAFLFCGPRGVGKTSCARILAKTLNCANRSSETEACNECPSCQRFNKGTSVNIYELDAASNNSVEDIRSLVDQVRYPPQDGKYKIYIIDEVHMLSTAAFNAFLKTLEEPPAYAVFVLATTEKHKILPTILSRCQVFDFHRIGLQDITHHLAHIAREEKVEAEHKALDLIARKADGALRDALSLFDQLVSFSGGELSYAQVAANLHVLDPESYLSLCIKLHQGQTAGVLLELDNILQKGFDGLHFLEGMAQHFRDLWVSGETEAAELLQGDEKYRKALKAQADELGRAWILNALQLSTDTQVAYRQSRNPRLLLELFLLKLCYLSRALGQPSPAKVGGATEAPPVQTSVALEDQKKKPDPEGIGKGPEGEQTTQGTLEQTQESVIAPNPGSGPKQALAPKPASGQTSPRIPSLGELRQKVRQPEPVAQKLEAKAPDQEEPQDPGSDQDHQHLSGSMNGTPVQQEESPRDLPQKELSPEVLAELSQDWARELQADSQGGLAAVFRGLTFLCAQDAVTLVVGAKFEADTLKPVLPDFKTYLKKKLGRELPELKVKVHKKEGALKNSSHAPAELFKEMVALNPALDLLREKFKLTPTWYANDQVPRARHLGREIKRDQDPEEPGNGAL